MLLNIDQTIQSRIKYQYHFKLLNTLALKYFKSCQNYEEKLIKLYCDSKNLIFFYSVSTQQVNKVKIKLNKLLKLNGEIYVLQPEDSLFS